MLQAEVHLKISLPEDWLDVNQRQPRSWSLLDNERFLGAMFLLL